METFGLEKDLAVIRTKEEELAGVRGSRAAEKVLMEPITERVKNHLAKA